MLATASAKALMCKQSQCDQSTNKKEELLEYSHGTNMRLGVFKSQVGNGHESYGQSFILSAQEIIGGFKQGDDRI